ncbi:hypothetical protein EVAR_7400_1 [Eumeta japonica]|uniref:Uncharacterized protein n=1 Tax=Eumeta variegata TaxID=151549 RepID=A0A4C1V674_EUMVA|nr:hypothetical protein EVAR_7400_1 [Eumeta japonica]
MSTPDREFIEEKNIMGKQQVHHLNRNSMPSCWFRTNLIANVILKFLISESKLLQLRESDEEDPEKFEHPKRCGIADSSAAARRRGVGSSLGHVLSQCTQTTIIDRLTRILIRPRAARPRALALRPRRFVDYQRTHFLRIGDTIIKDKI